MSRVSVNRRPYVPASIAVSGSSPTGPDSTPFINKFILRQNRHFKTKKFFREAEERGYVDAGTSGTE